MKISQELYNKMRRCHNAGEKFRELQSEIDNELEEIGVETYVYWEDSKAMSFYSYGNEVSKKEIQDNLDEHLIKDVEDKENAQ